MREYRAKNGQIYFKQAMSTIEESAGDYTGYCLACGEAQEGVEPDARRYDCENCGKPLVFGAEEMVLMGLVYCDDARAEAFPGEPV